MSTYNGKELVNSLYHGAILTALTVAYAKVGKAMKLPMPKLDFEFKDILSSTVYITSAAATKDILVKQGIIPEDIMK
jgi:hypothetical protein